MSSTDLVKEFVEVLKRGEMDDDTMWRIAMTFNDTLAENTKKEEDSNGAVARNEKKKTKKKNPKKKEVKKNIDKEKM